MALRLPASSFQSSPSVLVRRAISSAMRHCLPALVPVVALLGVASTAHAQTPLPNVISTVAGASSASPAAATTCGGTGSGSPYTSTDIYGDGCPGKYTRFGNDFRGGVAVDGQGNVFIGDGANFQIRKYDPKTTLVTRVAGGAGTNCVSTGTGNPAATGFSNDASGDGCVSASTSLAGKAPRGIAVDPYGNVLVADYGGSYVHVICNAISPICPGTTGRKQVGYMYRVAGCAGSATVTGYSGTSAASQTYAGGEADNSVANPFENLPGDITAEGGTGVGGTCSNTTAYVNEPRGVAADKFGNVYIAETGAGSYGNATSSFGLRYRVVLGPQTYNSVTNPLWALINNKTFTSSFGSVTYTAHEGYIYTIMGGFTGTATTKNSLCSGTTYYAEDTVGDGCPYTSTLANGGVQGVAVDTYGNVYFGDNVDALVRVLYVGGTGNPLTTAIAANSPSGNAAVTTPVVGNVYLLAGGGGTVVLSSTAGTAILGSSATLDSGISKITVGPGGNLYIGDFGSSSSVDFYDISTGYIRLLYKSGTNCAATVTAGSPAAPGTTTANGDGCPATGSTFNSNNAGLGIAVDQLGNMYIADTNTAAPYSVLRKVEGTSLIPITVGSSRTNSTANIQNLIFHGPANTTSMTATALDNATGITLGATTCNAANTDGTVDCTLPVTFAPLQPGKRALTVQISMLNSSSAVLTSSTFTVSGTAFGTALVDDVATPTTTNVAGTSALPVGAAVDGNGTLYYVDTHAGTVVAYNASASTVAQTTVGAAPASPLQVAVDPYGNVYVTSTGSATITKYTLSSTGTYSSSTVSYSGVNLPQAIAFDQQGNAYVADEYYNAATPVYPTVYEFAAGTTLVTAQPPFTVYTGTASSNLTSMAFDGTGALLIGDKGLNAVYRAVISSPGTSATTTVYPPYTTTKYVAASGGTATITGLTPSGVAGDAAGNVYVQDSASKTIYEVPLQASTTTVSVLTGLTTPTGLAIDGTGVLYSADTGTGKVLAIARNAATYGFGTTTGTMNFITGTFTNAGNLSATGYALAEAGSDFFFDATGTGLPATTCGTIPSTTNPVLPGATCIYSAYYSGAASDTGVLSYLAASSTTGSFTVTGTKPAGSVVYPTTTTVTPTGNSGTYSANENFGPFTVTVAATMTTDVPTGSVAVTVTGCTAGSGTYTLTTGATTATATFNISGCTAGTVTLKAVYSQTADGATTNSFGGSDNTASLAAFTVNQATPVVSWTPSATTQQYSASIGTGVLDATATSGGNTIPGYFLYTATPSGGMASTIHAATYLPLGTYALGVTFVPTDTTDYTSASTASVPTYTVTQASTTAAIGSTQTLVAADGSGNFTSVQAAVTSIPAAGGASVYIKPGTYKENVLVVQPSVAIRGLGGDATAVILTHSAGAFGSATPGAQSYAAGSTDAANATEVGLQGTQLASGSTQYNGDQGSATLLVNPGINATVSSSILMPNNFYAENLTVVNTYDTDTVTTTTTQLAGGICTANAGTAQTYNYLYNNSLLCASQAIAIANRADLSIYNNVYATSSQDTLMADSTPLTSNVNAGSTLTTVGRQYYFRGKYTGSTDYLFGNAAAVFDYTSIYTIPHGTSYPGSSTIEAQQQTYQTGSNSAYFSGYVANSSVFTSFTPQETTGESTANGLLFGRPYGAYSTWIMLNDFVDQVNPVGYIPFGGTTALTNATYAEYNDLTYTDPSTGSPDANGVIYMGLGGNTGFGVTGTRETVSQDPGTPEANNAVKTTLTAAQATLYYPRAFLATSVTGSPSGVTNWNHTAAIASDANAFVPSTSVTSAAYGSAFTLLMRPQTPGLGAVTNGTYTIPTGTYTLFDSGTQIATGNLDASGEAYYSSKSLAVGAHAFSWSYSGDTNFAASTTGNGATLNVTITAAATTTTLAPSTQTAVYGQAVPLTATVAVTGGGAPPAGSVSLYVDGSSTAYATATLTGGPASFSVSGLNAGSHTFAATYAGNTMYSTSSGTASATVTQATLVVTGVGTNRVFNQANTLSYNVTGYQYTDTAATVFSAGPTVSTTATQDSVAGTYTVVPAATLSTFGSMNYTLVLTNGSFTITGGAPQSVIFDPLPNFASGGSYQLTARTTSGLTPSYTVTSGSATVSGSTLTVTAPGTVTVQATTLADPTGDYAAPTPVSRTFTAQ